MSSLKVYDCAFSSGFLVLLILFVSRLLSGEFGFLQNARLCGFINDCVILAIGVCLKLNSISKTSMLVWMLFYHNQGLLLPFFPLFCSSLKQLSKVPLLFWLVLSQKPN